MNTEDLTEVTLTHPFALQQTELTQAQWVAMGFPNRAGTRDDGAGGTDCVGDACPASTLGWCEAMEFANRMSKKEGRHECVRLLNPRGTIGSDFTCDGIEYTGASYYDCDGYRLPTSGEWEYATRAGTRTAFFSGAELEPTGNCVGNAHLEKVAWFCANAGGHSHEVCTRQPNPWGLFDMVGNAAEYVADTGSHGYGPGPVTDPPLAVSRTADMERSRLTRGSFYFGTPVMLRSADQSFMQPLDGPYARTVALGFRLARTLTPREAETWASKNSTR